jgi:hypothetical protein
MVRVLSYGGGVQTRALLRLILGGKWERPDAIVFADTGDEPTAIYEALEDDQSASWDAKIPFHVVSEGRPLSIAIVQGPGVFIPAFTSSTEHPEGRYPWKSCTGRFKIAPMLELYRKMGWTEVENWLGFTIDEIERVKPAKVEYVTNRYPLIELDMTRGDCEAVLVRHGLPVRKSSCVYCPNRSRAAWQEVRVVPEDWAKAQNVDAAIRDREAGCQTYLHRARKPLAECVNVPQASLFGEDCESGYCGT